MTVLYGKKNLCFIMKKLDPEINKGWNRIQFSIVLDICWKILHAKTMKHVAYYRIFP